MGKSNTDTTEKQTVRFSVAPTPVQYSYFCRFDETESVMICPDKEMPRLSDLVDGFNLKENDPLGKWLEERRINCNEPPRII